MKNSCAQATIVILSILLVSSPALFAGVYGGGSGIDEAPYQIGTAAHWQELMTTLADWGGHFVLTGDIDLKGVTLTPVGYEGVPFTGSFSGSGFVIRNVLLLSPIFDNVGLFGYLGPTGQLRSITVDNLRIIGAHNVGGLCGWNSGILDDCRVSGVVMGMGEVGGLCGWNVGIISRCFAAGSVAGESSSVGGLCGWTTFGSIRDCYASSSVEGYDHIGGLCGYSNKGEVMRCFATGDVRGTANVGGLFGRVDFTTTNPISGCFWDTQSTGQNNATGFGPLDGATGKTTAEMKTLATFTDAGWDFSDTDGDAADWQMPADSYPRLIWETILSFSPDHGVYWGTQNVTIRSSAPAATIHYTIDGDEPTQNDPVIASGSILPISQSLTLKAKAWHDGSVPSETKTAAYTIKRICPAGDLDGDCKVDMRDFAILSQWWLEICDITNNWCDGVDLDLSGQIDLGELEDVAADNLDEEPVVNHVQEISIQVSRDYGDTYVKQYYGRDMTHDFSLNISTDAAVSAIEFTTPAGNTFSMSSASYAWREPYPGGLLSGGRGTIGPDWFLWEYQVMFFSADSLAAYGDGLYTITVHYADGGTQQATVWYGVPGTANPIPTPTQVPTFTSFTNGGTVSSPVSFNWQPCTDPAVQYIGMGVVYGDYWGFEDATPTGLDAPVPLAPGKHDAWIYFESYYYFETEDGISVGIGKMNQSHYTITVN
jgi:hypothetical protein